MFLLRSINVRVHFKVNYIIIRMQIEHFNTFYKYEWAIHFCTGYQYKNILYGGYLCFSVTLLG